jgi:O-antigen/teichoic acid export membrane protein
LRSPLLAGSVAIMTTTAVASLLGIVFWGVSTHLLAPRQIGAAAIALAFASGFALLGSQGIQPALIVRLPALPERRRGAATAAAAFLAIVATTIVALAGVVAVPHLSLALGVVLTPGMAALVVVAAAAQAAAGISDAACIAERRARGMTGRNTAFAIAKLLAVAAALVVLPAGVRSAHGAEVIVATWAAANGISAIVALGWLHGSTGLNLERCELAEHARSLRGVGAHHISTLGGQLPGLLFPILVGLRLGASSAAFFNVAWMVGSICVFISPAVGTALLADGRHEPSQLVQRARASALLIGLGLVVPALVLVFAGGPLLSLFGASYVTSGGRWLLVAVAFSAFPDAITNITVAVWRVRGRLTAASLLNAGMAVTSLALSWLLLPHVGVSAPGWAWLAAQTAGTAAVIVSARRKRRSTSSPMPATWVSEG